MRYCEKCKGRLPGKKGHGFVYGHRLLCSRCSYPATKFKLAPPSAKDGYRRF